MICWMNSCAFSLTIPSSVFPHRPAGRTLGSRDILLLRRRSFPRAVTRWFKSRWPLFLHTLLWGWRSRRTSAERYVASLFTHPSMGLAVKTHLPHAPSAHFLTVGVRMVWIARSTTQGGEGCARRVRIAVRKTFTAVAFSALEREPSFYLGLCGPSLRSALQGCIAFEWGLGLSAPAHGVYGCCPL